MLPCTSRSLPERPFPPGWPPPGGSCNCHPSRRCPGAAHTPTELSSLSIHSRVISDWDWKKLEPGKWRNLIRLLQCVFFRMMSLTRRLLQKIIFWTLPWQLPRQRGPPTAGVAPLGVGPQFLDNPWSRSTPWGPRVTIPICRGQSCSTPYNHGYEML